MYLSQNLPKIFAKKIKKTILKIKQIVGFKLSINLTIKSFLLLNCGTQN